jgi:hypothetical protein
VAAKNFLLGGLPSLDVVGERGEEDSEPFGGLWMAEGRVQLGEEPV